MDNNVGCNEEREEEDDTCQGLQLEIRIIVPSFGRNRTTIRDEIGVLLTNAGIELDTEQLRLVPAPQAAYEEELLEAVIPIRYGSSYSVDVAVSWCNIVDHGLHVAVRLEFISPHSYSLNCKPDHSAVQLISFSLGSFRNMGIFEEHYCSTPTDHNTRPHIDFEHDCRQLHLYMQSVSRGGQGQRRFMYLLSLYYSSIHSLVVDYCEMYEPDAIGRPNFKVPATVVYVCVNHPPRIYARHGRRYVRDRKLHDFDEASMGKCNVFKIMLLPWCGSPIQNNQQGRMEWRDMVHEMVSRVKARSGCRVFYTGIRTRRQSNRDQIAPFDLPSFKCHYLLHALVYTRPFNIADQVDDRFMDYVKSCVVQNEDVAEKALMQLLGAADENRYFNLLNAFTKIFQAFLAQPLTRCVWDSPSVSKRPRDDAAAGHSQLGSDEDDMVAKNCVRVRKLVITPTRHMLLPPQPILANRVLRQFGEEYALRVVIRDEDGRKHADWCTRNTYVRSWLKRLMLVGYVIGQRRYRFLGPSNSQMRDYGFCMYATTADGSDALAIRRWMGNFYDMRNVPKFVSRMGLCFTQTLPTVELPWGSGLFDIEEDVVGGLDHPDTGERSVFSDGCGRMARYIQAIVCKLIGVWPVCSVIQVRCGGFKGILSVDPSLDNTDKQVRFRKSMHKFESNSCILEVVKYSQPCLVYLNRPLIMILDQVSERPFDPNRRRSSMAMGNTEQSQARRIAAGRAVHARVCDRIKELLDEELLTMADMLMDEKASAVALTTRTNLGINFKQLKEAGFNLTAEPFFRGMLLAIHQHVLSRQQLRKQKIEVPPHLGRTMFGMMDTQNFLQYGQVFVQYSKDMNKPGEDLQVVRGPVMVTKNPCVSGGDVRVLTAVPAPQWSNLYYDVIVFPQNGPRSHSDEIAGSDLDGDEYAVYWDTDLMMDCKQIPKPMYFPKRKKPDVKGEVKDEDMVEYFLEYLEGDCIGRVANVHLAIADEKGLFSDVAGKLAVKHAMAVDYCKTGVPPDQLTWEESPVVWPDFLEKYDRPMRQSGRLVGHLYRRIRSVSNVIRLAQRAVSSRSGVQFDFDSDLEVSGWQVFEADTVELLDGYTREIQLLLDRYGVTDECSLVSGHMTTIKNRLSDGDREDFSFVNTERTIRMELKGIFQKFRRIFFHEFGGENEEILQMPNENVQQKASAWYQAAYRIFPLTKGTTMRSFAWIVWDVLRYIKAKRVYELYAMQMEARVIDPMAEKLTRAIQEFCTDSSDNIERMLALVTSTAEDDPIGGLIRLYTTVYNPDLVNLLTVVLHWLELEINSGQPNPLWQIDMARLLIEFCQQRGYVERGSSLEEEVRSNCTLRKQLIPLGIILLDFLKYLASEKNKGAIRTVLDVDNNRGAIGEQQIDLLSRLAFKTYHHVAWTNCFRSLHLPDDRPAVEAGMEWDMEPITIIFGRVMVEHLGICGIAGLLKCWSGVQDVNIRCKLNRQNANRMYTDEFIVSGIGKMEACEVLRELLLRNDISICLFQNRNPLLTREL